MSVARTQVSNEMFESWIQNTFKAYLRLDSECACVLHRARHSPLVIFQIRTTLSGPVWPLASNSPSAVRLRADTYNNSFLIMHHNSYLTIFLLLEAPINILTEWERMSFQTLHVC